MRTTFDELELAVLRLLRVKGEHPATGPSAADPPPSESGAAPRATESIAPEAAELIRRALVRLKSL